MSESLLYMTILEQDVKCHEKHHQSKLEDFLEENCTKVTSEDQVWQTISLTAHLL